ncbi:MAG: molybdopterin dinucleotide binding domain-containing protein, partial [Promethearchaeota archaeon]
EIRYNLRNKGYHIPFDIDNIPFNDLKFPTSNGKIQISNFHIKLFNPTTDILLHRNNDEFYLLSPSHKYFIHSQFGEIYGEFKKDFTKVFLNPIDIETLRLKPNEEVLVSNDFGKAKYILDQKDSLKPGTALIYSGSPFIDTKYKNVNFLTPDKPEESGLSGAYFSTIIKISKI